MGTNLPIYSDLIYNLAGIATEQLGQVYKVYRLNGNTAGAVISANSLVHPAFNFYFEKAQKSIIENTTFDLQVFSAIGDATQLRVGDILVETGFGSDGGTYCVAQIRNRKPFRTILVRVESQSAIQEPQPDAGSDETQPMSGPVWVEGAWGGATVDARYNLTLDNGMYQMLPFGEGTLASVPIGIQPLNKVRDSHKPGIPTPYARTLYLAYIPPTPGYDPAEKDIIKAANMESYEISQIYSSTPVGLSGSIAICERMAT